MCESPTNDVDHSEEDAAWQERERERQWERTLPVWQCESWAEIRQGCAHLHHYTHVSANNPKLLAYTADADKGRRDIQTPIKPGRYLARYFADVLTPKQIAYFAAWQSTGKRDSPYLDAAAYQLKFATTPADIAQVYRHGPQSCMDGRAFRHAESHPCRVYGAGDLAIAYLESATGKIVARTLCWPERKIFGRIYPTDYCWGADGFSSQSDSELCAEALAQRLRDLAYRQDGATGRCTGFNGAKLLRVDAQHGSGYAMPYLDHAYRVDDDGDHFVMRTDGEYAADNTNGTLDYDGENEDELPEYDWMCEYCEQGFYDGGDESAYDVYTDYRRGRPYNVQSWCEHCRERHAFYCEATEEHFSRDDVESVHVHLNDLDDTVLVALPWADDNCYCSEYSDAWFYSEEFASVEMYDGDTWAEFERDQFGFVCVISGRSYPADKCHPEHANIGFDVDATGYDLDLHACRADTRQLESAI